EAIFFLGQQYYHGKVGLKRDRRKAVELWTEAAELGSIDALYNLGYAYFNGDEVEPDNAKGVEFWSKAAMQGHVNSRRSLGQAKMLRGNFDRAVRHWMISAKMGDKDSIENIKREFMKGLATKDQYAEALRGYQDAVEEMKSHDRDEAKAIFSQAAQDRRCSSESIRVALARVVAITCNAHAEVDGSGFSNQHQPGCFSQLPGSPRPHVHGISMGRIPPSRPAVPPAATFSFRGRLDGPLLRVPLSRSRPLEPSAGLQAGSLLLGTRSASPGTMRGFPVRSLVSRADRGWTFDHPAWETLAAGGRMRPPPPAAGRPSLFRAFDLVDLVAHGVDTPPPSASTRDGIDARSIGDGINQIGPPHLGLARPP
ncbi:hypothetical protein THAOC_00551, partial [Thalassiosira oceanica]